MRYLISIFLILMILFISLNPSLSYVHVAKRRNLLQNDAASCPLNFTLLPTLTPLPSSANITFRCQYLRQGLRLLLSDLLRRTNTFLPPVDTSDACFEDYKVAVRNIIGDFDISASCGLQKNWSSQGCLNISTRSEFEARTQPAALESLYKACNESLAGSACETCYASIINLRATSLGDAVGDNITDCPAISSIYTAGIVNRYGPSDLNTARCLFYIDLAVTGESSNRRRIVVIVVVCVVCLVVFVVVVIGLALLWIKQRKRFPRSRSSVGFYDLDFSMEIVTLKEFSFDEVKAATKNFSRDNIIGSGTYGNVYRGVLADGTEVAFKRFKNLSVAGNETFKHELEIISSVRHGNLVGVIGYCTWTTEFEGNQRIIVCDLLKNGSLYDYLFGSKKEKLSWPVRRKIAIGTARGLAYLHNGVQPAIIHRDVKSSNILLDETFEPKVADFGMAKFTPDGMTHLSTRVSGTMGYVAPEYALYGRLTERSDVYSFGVVLLELLTGKKAFTSSGDGQVSLLIDWVWSFVQEGRTLDIVEDMQDVDPPEVMEKYVKIAVLCSHTQLYARPTMSEVVKLLDDDIPVPTIPDRPVSFVANMNDLQRSVSAFVNTNDLERSVSTFGSGPPATGSG